MAVGRRIAETREEQEITQEALAELIPIEVRNLRRVESGRQNITLRTLARIARALDVDPIELLAPAKSAKRRRGRPRKKRA